MSKNYKYETASKYLEMKLASITTKINILNNEIKLCVIRGDQPYLYHCHKVNREILQDKYKSIESLNN